MTVATWAALVWMYPVTAVQGHQRTVSIDSNAMYTGEITDNEEEMTTKVGLQQKPVTLTGAHYFFLVLSVALIIMMAFQPALEPYVGNPAVLALGLVALTFGSGFCSMEDFNKLSW